MYSRLFSAAQKTIPRNKTPFRISSRQHSEHLEFAFLKTYSMTNRTLQYRKSTILALVYGRLIISVGPLKTIQGKRNPSGISFIKTAFGESRICN
jgi:hypothetical protein